jgi:hypothetical protein
MPPLLKRDTIRMLEAAVNCLHLGLLGLGLPRAKQRVEGSRLAAELGLIGSAAELSVGACLMQTAGLRALRRQSGMFKTAAEVFDDFRALVEKPTPAFDFVTSGTPKPDAHRQSLLAYGSKFRLLATLRAAALHTGHAPDRQVCVSLANDVAGFLELLSRSTRLRPYLPEVPRPFELVVESAVMIEDLQRRLAHASAAATQASVLASLFLVLPEVPENAPEWLAAFDRISVAPKRTDLKLLVKTLEAAIPVSLRRGKGSGAVLPVRVEPENPDALAIAPQYLRTEFTKKPDRFFADVGTANGRLNEGTFDHPPLDFVRELCAIGLDESAVLEPGQELSAHQTWPFIAASLAANGTPGPIWFLVRRCSDLNQLQALLRRVAQLRPAHYVNNYEAVRSGIESIASATRTQRSGLFRQLLDFRRTVEQRRERLIERLRDTEGTDRRLPTDLEATVRQVQREAIAPGAAILAILERKPPLSDESRIHWSRVLAEVATSADDLPGLLAVSRLPGSTTAHTAARKAFQLIDFLESGPELETAT